MTPVTALPGDLQQALGDCDVIVFDGECVLCSGFFRFMLRHDKGGRFHFATAQSPLGTALYRALDLPTTDYETNLVVVGGRIFTRLDAFAAAMRALGGIWRVPALCRFLPGPIKHPLYHLIARNRYRIFGRYDACMIPDEQVKSRFLPTGWG